MVLIPIEFLDMGINAKSPCRIPTTFGNSPLGENVRVSISKGVYRYSVAELAEGCCPW